MSHKTLVNGTVYEVDGGKTLIDGVAYSIDKGKTFVGGTAYDIGFCYTITYSANGAEGFTADKMPYTPGSTVTLKESRYKNEDDTGKIEFIGWNTKADGSGTAYQPGDEITVDKNIILYAQWDKDAGDYIYRKPPAQNRTLLEIMVEFLDKII